jgi:Fe2+ or Zn2+ uptake regulation protein
MKKKSMLDHLSPSPSESSSLLDNSCLQTNGSNYLDRCVNEMVRAGLRITQPRRAVISCFATATHPLTVAQLSDVLAHFEGEHGHLSKVSIYRVVADLERLHLLHRIHPGGGYFRCIHVGCEAHPHVLLTCNRCEHTQETPVPFEYLGPLFFFLRDQEIHLPPLPVLRLEGVCEQCKMRGDAIEGPQ